MVKKNGSVPKGHHKMPDGSIMKNGTHGGKKKAKKGGKQSPWISHVMKTHKDGLKKNKDYKYKDAMKDAKKTYKK